GAVSHVLTIDTVGESAALGSIVISCSCGKSSTMQGAFGRTALQHVKKCDGNRPWLRDRESCGRDLRTLQRGASNTYFPVLQSALSIPPWSEGALKIINRSWHVLQHVPDVSLEATIRGMGIAEGTSYSVQNLVDAVRTRKSGEEGTLPDSVDLRPQ